MRPYSSRPTRPPTSCRPSTRPVAYVRYNLEKLAGKSGLLAALPTSPPTASRPVTLLAA